MYSNRILELFKNPTNAGGLQGANGTGKYIDEACGDYVKIYLKIDENEVISEARFKAMGNVATIVASSAICSCLLDCKIDEALKVDADRICEVTGEFPADKVESINFAIQAVKLAIDNYYEKLEKEQKKLGKTVEKTVDKKQTIKNAEKTEDIVAVANERKAVSAAKAAFDALFEE
ncbi:MAG: iron-sulfur cluster assembly scaffold protein [Clostridiales bacterium]|nr:iron-sulfur cluster assembly scaffold protein [Clostridiales bacterium]